MEQPADTTPATPNIQPARRWTGISPIWLVPLFTLFLALWLVYQHYTQLGPEIQIHFKTANGLEAKMTRIRYKDVEIGKVTNIDLASDLSGVVVTAQMINSAHAWMRENTRFWVVRPRISLSGVSGLGTLVSGTYIQADVVDDGAYQYTFEGLENPPQTEAGAPGLRLTLQAEQAGSLDIGAPVYYRQIPVGQVEARRFANDGVEFEIFIHAPHHERVTSATRFWNVSGLQATLSSEGVDIQTETLESLLAGGIAFGNPSGEWGKQVENDMRFSLYASYVDAQEQIFAEGISARLTYRVYFRESVRGLKVGAPVEYLGVPVGRVSTISLRYEEGLDNAYIPVTIELEPERMGIAADANHARLIENAIKQGLQAQLQTGSLVTGQLFVALRMIEDAEQVAQVGDQPEIPSIASELTLLSEKAYSAIDKLLALPLDQLVSHANTTIVSANALLTADSTQAISTNANQVLTQLRSSLATLENSLRNIESLTANSNRAVKNANAVLTGIAPESPLYYELTTTLQALQETAESIQTLSATLERNPRALILGQ
jgi:paraquat-inducible protein B